MAGFLPTRVKKWERPSTAVDAGFACVYSSQGDILGTTQERSLLALTSPQLASTLFATRSSLANPEHEQETGRAERREEGSASQR